MAKAVEVAVVDVTEGEDENMEDTPVEDTVEVITVTRTVEAPYILTPIRIPIRTRTIMGTIILITHILTHITLILFTDLPLWMLKL